MEVKLRNYLKIGKEILLMVISGVFDIENQASAVVAWVRSNVHGFIRSSFYLTSLPHLQKRRGGYPWQVSPPASDNLGCNLIFCLLFRRKLIKLHSN